MSRSLSALWIVLIAAVATISALAYVWSAEQERVSDSRVADLLANQLLPHRQAIARVFDEYSVELQQLTASCNLREAQSCAVLQRSPLVLASVVVDADAIIRFPMETAHLSTDRRLLIEEAGELLLEQSDWSLVESSTRSRLAQSSVKGGQSLPPPLVAPTPAAESKAIRRAAAYEWLTWYHGRGMMLGFTWQTPDQWRGLLLLPRSRWMADVVAVLPDHGATYSKFQWSEVDSSDSNLLQQLVDVEGNVIYQWGSGAIENWEAFSGEQPHATLALSEPLEGWRLRSYATEDLRHTLAGYGSSAPLWLGVAGLSASLILVGLLVTVNFNRQVRLAQQRVTFVNQVSHELRTPLTNICMYADLLAQSLELEDGSKRGQMSERVAVIQGESQRLSRLISNVLQFARPDSKQQQLQQLPAQVDHIVQEVIATFQPRLDELGFKVEADLQTLEPRLVASDALEQILVNLISNVEKYAMAGKWLGVKTRGSDDTVQVIVSDRGPGIPRRFRTKIFSPFVRLNDRLQDPAGTGIGLTIARQLARKHGGDCVFIESQRGAVFCCTLAAPLLGQNQRTSASQ